MEPLRRQSIGISEPAPGRMAARVCILLFLCLQGIAWSEVCWCRQGPPPPPAPPRRGPRPQRLDAASVSVHLQDVRRHLEEIEPKDPDSKMLLGVARRTLNEVGERPEEKDILSSDRRIAAADAFLHAAERAIHLTEGPKGPVPQPREIAEHLQRVYFRQQQADFFASAGNEPDAKRLSGLARKYYEEARKAYDSGGWFAADEYAKSADDTIRGLENLAQAAVAEPPAPP
jgi:hypothetical protein